MMRFSYYFKNQNFRIMESHPVLMYVLSGFVIWATSEKIPVIITDSVSSLAEDQKLKRVSKTHREGRAVDISTRGWNAKQIQMSIDFLNSAYIHFAALDIMGKPRLVVHHDSGSGPHLHIQINKAYALKELNFNS
jgi:hypothetical protein